jgi:hypothetical protein
MAYHQSIPTNAKLHATLGSGAPLGGNPMSELNQIMALLRKLKKRPIKTFPVLHQKIDAPQKPGVYIIYSPRGRVEHVGESRSIAGRLRGHMGNSSSYVNKSLRRRGAQLRGAYRYRYLTVVSPRRRMLLQAMAIGQLCPRHLGDRRLQQSK